MGGEWREVAIGELAEIFDGPHATPKKISDGPVFLGISNLAHGRLDLSNTEHLSEDDYVRWTRRIKPKPGDVVFSYETRLGEAALIPLGLRCCLGRRMGLLRALPGKVDPRFLLYAYLGPRFQETLRSRTIHGSTVDRIPLIDMPGFPIEVPEGIDEQRAIAHVLGALDDKIELNRQMNETLEAMARALFKSWFVDFEPVRTKAEGRDPGLPREIADLFPDGFADSELGEIPRGWRLETISGLADLNAWTLSKTDDIDPIEYIEISEVIRGNVGEIQVFRRGEEPSRARRRLRHGDTVLSTVRPERGSYFLCLNPIPNLIASTGFAVFSPCRAPWSFVHAALTQPEVFQHLGRLADGGAYPAIRPEAIGQWQVPWPDQPVLVEEFHRICGPLYERVQHNRHESRTLAGLRDTLLPKLLSGQVRVA
jgi:type I restriction enzyme S subunit